MNKYNMIEIPLDSTLDYALEVIQHNRTILNGATWKAIAENRHSDVVEIAEFYEYLNYIEQMVEAQMKGKLAPFTISTKH
jgi:hypothetical protein